MVRIKVQGSIILTIFNSTEFISLKHLKILYKNLRYGFFTKYTKMVNINIQFHASREFQGTWSIAYSSVLFYSARKILYHKLRLLQLDMIRRQILLRRELKFWRDVHLGLLAAF